MRHYFENPTLYSLTSVFIVTQGLFLSDFSVATLLKKLMRSFCAIALSWIPPSVSECGFFVVCLSAFQIRCYYVSQTGLELCLHASLHLYLGNVQDCFCTPLHPAHLWWFFSLALSYSISKMFLILHFQSVLLGHYQHLFVGESSHLLVGSRPPGQLRPEVITQKLY